MKKEEVLRQAKELVKDYPRIYADGFAEMFYYYAEKMPDWGDKTDLIIETCMLENLNTGTEDVYIENSDSAKIMIENGCVYGEFWAGEFSLHIPVKFHVLSQYNDMMEFGKHTVISSEIEREFILKGVLDFEDYLPDTVYTIKGHRIQCHRAVLPIMYLGGFSSGVDISWVICDIVTESDLQLIIGGEHNRESFRNFFRSYALLGHSLLKKFSRYNLKPKSLTVYV